MNARLRFPASVAGKTTNAIALCIALWSGIAIADSDDHDTDHERARKLQEAGEILPLERILDAARRVHPGGKILEIEFEEKKSRRFYELEVLTTEGVVHEMYFDAQTGELIKTKKEK